MKSVPLIVVAKYLMKHGDEGSRALSDPHGTLLPLIAREVGGVHHAFFTHFHSSGRERPQIKKWENESTGSGND